MKKNISKEMKKMRIAFLKDSIKKNAFSFYVEGDFKQKLKKLKTRK